MSLYGFRFAVYAMSLCTYLFSLWVEQRQYRHLSRNPSIPPKQAKLCTPKEYKESRAYAMDKTWFSMVSGCWQEACGMALLVFDVLPRVWAWSGRYCGGGGEISQSLIFVGVWVVWGELIVDLLPSLYSTFVVERKHAFNKTSIATFTLDKIKSLALTMVLGLPIVSALIWVIRRCLASTFLSSPLLLVPCLCLFLLAVQLAMIVIAPTVLMPLFNTFTALPPQKQPLKQAIEQLASKLSFPLAQIFVVDGSRRSSHSNAYFFGLFDNKRIVLFDTLLSDGDAKTGDGGEEEVGGGMSDREIVAIVAHEMGHWAHNHMLAGLISSQVFVCVNLIVYSLIIDYAPFYTAFGFPPGGDKPIIVGLILLLQYLLTPINVAMGFIFSYLSRAREFEADAFAYSQGFGDALPGALVKLYARNKSFVYPDWLYSALHYSHPPPSERLAALDTLGKKDHRLHDTTGGSKRAGKAKRGGDALKQE